MLDGYSDRIQNKGSNNQKICQFLVKNLTIFVMILILHDKYKILNSFSQ